MANSSLVSIHCPECEHEFEVLKTLPVGTLINCPQCKTEMALFVSNTTSSAPRIRPHDDELVLLIPPEPEETPEQPYGRTPAPQNMSAKFFDAAKKTQPRSKLPWMMGVVGIVAALGALGYFFVPGVASKVSAVAISALFSSSETNASEASANSGQSLTAPEPDSGKEESSAGSEKVETADAKRLKAELEADPIDEQKRTETQTALAAAEKEFAEAKAAVDEASRMAAKRRSTAAKIKTQTAYIHDGGMRAYDKSLAEMNTAQDTYDFQNRTAIPRARTAALNHAQDAIDLAFCHGLEAYDYLIEKKKLQLEAALALDIEGFTAPEKEKIREQLNEGRWLAEKYGVMWWIGAHGMRRMNKYWVQPTINATHKGLFPQDRYNERLKKFEYGLDAAQIAALEKFQ